MYKVIKYTFIYCRESEVAIDNANDIAHVETEAIYQTTETGTIYQNLESDRCIQQLSIDAAV